MKIQLGSIELTKRQVYALGWIEPFWNGWTRDRVRTLNLRCTPRFAYEFVDDNQIAHGCAPYSTHDGMALAALKLWHEKHPSTNWGLSYCIESDPPYGCAIYPKPWRDYSGYAPTLALAICRAIVTAAEAKGD